MGGRGGGSPLPAWGRGGGGVRPGRGLDRIRSRRRPPFGLDPTPLAFRAGDGGACHVTTELSRRRDRQFAVLDRPMISLQHDRPRLLLIAVERPSSGSRNVRPANHLSAV